MVPLLAAVAIGAGVLTIGGIALASAGPRWRRARYLIDRGVLVRGLDMNRTTRDGRVVPHWGLDLGAPEGTPVHAAKGGTIIFSRPLRGYGNTIMLRHGDDRRSTLYAHLQHSNVQEGQGVNGDDVIGAVGSTRHGRNVRWEDDRFVSVGAESAGAVGQPVSPHLHFEAHPGPVPQIGSRPRRLDPVTYLRQEGIGLVGAPWRPSGVPRVA